jgi:hypothetical protein
MRPVRGRSSIVALLAAATLALGACGGDDEGNGTTGADTPIPGATTNTGTTETGTTGTTEGERTGTTPDDRTTTSERGDDKGGRDRSGSGGGGSGRGSDDSGGGSQPSQPGDVYKVARTVCKTFLPKLIARDLEKGDKSPEEVARDYSRGFRERQRQRAYEGCLAGLKARR